MVKRSVRRKPVTAADLKSAQKKSRKRKSKSLTRQARERFLARANKRGLMKRAAANAAAALPAAPTKLQQLEARVRAGVERDPLSNGAISLPDDPLTIFVDPLPDPPPFSGRGDEVSSSRDERGASVSETNLTARVRALYEDGLVPVREIARLVGVSERTLYKYAARGRWRKRYARRALAKGFVRGTGGRFVAHELTQDAAGAAAHAPSGLKALDPLAATAAEAACAEAGRVAARAAGRTLAGHEVREEREALMRMFETRVRRLALLARAIKFAGVAPVSALR